MPRVIKSFCCAAFVITVAALAQTFHARFTSHAESIPPAPGASEAALIDFVERHATSDGGYGWYAADEPAIAPDPHLTPTHAAVGIYHLLGRQAPRRDALVGAVIELHPYRGPRAESVKHAAEVWPLTYAQLEALRWLDADRDPRAADLRAWTEQWTGISAYPATYERAAHPVLQLEMFGLLTRRLAGLPVEQPLRTLVPYLDARQRENGSFNNLPAAQGGDGHVSNTWWAIAALQAAEKPVTRQASLVEWLQACQRPNGGFASSPHAAKDALGLDDLQYTWAAVRALAAFGAAPSNGAAAIEYLRALRTSDGGFGHRPGEPSDIVAAYYALDALRALRALTPLPPAPAVPAVPPVKTQTASAASDPVPAGLRAYTIQIQAPGQGSPEDAVELARALRIHLWGAKNTTAEWIRTAQAIARERAVPVTFFSAGEVYGQFVSLPGLGSYSHVADDMSPLPVDAGMPPVPRQQVERTWAEFAERRVEPLERAGGRLVWQISDNEEFSRTLLDQSMRGAPAYAAISTFHMRQNFVAILPWLQRYRHAIPFVTLQDAHGSEPWWWGSDLTAHRTVFLAPAAASGQGPTWTDWLEALRLNRVASIRRDAITGFRTRVIGGAAGVRTRVLQASREWQWWDERDRDASTAVSASAIARPLASIVALSAASDGSEAGRPDRGIRLRIRTAWENDTQGRPVREVARLVTLRVDDRDVSVSANERRDDRGRLTDVYALADVSTLAPGTHTATATIRHVDTGVEHQVARTFRAGDAGDPGDTRARAPNIVVILADDLGYGEIGPFGQTKIETPRLDRFAAEGMRFTHFYAGSAVCAPSRATLLTGKHSGRAYVRGNHELGGFTDEEERGQLPLPPDEPTLARWLRARGYATAAVGKWGLGGPGSTGLPTRHGFDLFFGYLDQKQAHNYYPTHLWKNGARVPLRNAWFSPHQRLDGDASDPSSYTRFTGSEYAIDRMTGEAVEFLEGCAGRRGTPCFLYFAPTIPHLALQVPEAVRARYDGRFPETPYTGDKGYLPHRTPRAAYAAMITHLDTQVGMLLDTLRRLDLDRDTLVFFTSDNGARGNGGGADTRFFASNGELRGTKGTLYEGGIRVPMLARWPGRIAAGTTSPHPAANWDLWATIADLLNAPAPADTDGVSFTPTLLGKPGQQPREALYWEFHEGGKSQAVRMGRWKAVRRYAQGASTAPIELYDLERDPAESKDVAADHPDLVVRIATIMRREHKPAALEKWNFP